MAAAAALLAAPRAAGAAERVLIVADARIPDGAETAASVARTRGFDVQVAPPDFSTMVGCAGGDLPCWAKAGTAVGALWILVLEISAPGPPPVVVVRRIAVSIPAEVGAISGPVGATDGVAALAELVASVAGTPAGAAPAAAVAAEPASPPAERGRSPVRVGLAIGATGAAAALAGAAAFFALSLASVQADYDRAPNESLAQLEELDRLARRGRTDAVAADTLMVAAGVAAVAGVAFWVLWLAGGRAHGHGAVEASASGLLVRW